MAQTTLSVRIDEDVKRGLEEFCSAVGMNVSVAVNMFAKTVVREQRLPFEVTLHTRDNHLKQVMLDVQNKRNLSKEFSSVSELMEDLNADN